MAEDGREKARKSYEKQNFSWKIEESYNDKEALEVEDMGNFEDNSKTVELSHVTEKPFESSNPFKTQQCHHDFAESMQLSREKLMIVHLC
jgi:hypothetical protein